MPRTDVHLEAESPSRQAILDAATRLVAQSSYAGTSMAAVSKASGLPASSIYWHFGSKQGLFKAVLERCLHDWLSTLEAILAGSGPEARDLQGWLRASALAFRRRPEAPRLLLMLPLELRERDPVVLDFVREARAVAVDMMRRGLAVRLPVHPGAERLDALADFAVSQMHGAFLADQIDSRANDIVAAFARLGRVLVAAAHEPELDVS